MAYGIALQTPDAAWARYRLNKVWNFIATTPVGQPASLDGRTEFTVSRILGGRALYVTAMAPQPHQGETRGSEQPLYFYMHAATLCERQIGRAVDRLMHMGTLRLAAIYALPHLMQIREKLERVEKDVSSARELTHKLIGETKKKYASAKLRRKATKVAEAEILEKLDLIQKTMADLSDGSDPPKLGKYLGNATLEYRLIRSLYYRNTFFGLLDSLRIRRLEGYQPYDEFVRRRLGSAFGFIEGVERRIEQIKSDWRALDQLYLSTTVTVLTDEIISQQDESAKVQYKIESIQFLGETLLIAIIAPHYFLTLFFDSINCTDSMEFAKESWCVSHTLLGATERQLLTIVVWMTFVSMAIARARSVRREADEAGKD